MLGSWSLPPFCAGYGIAVDGEEHLPQPSRRSDINDPFSLPKPVCRHRAPTLFMCRTYMPLLGRVLPVWALSCVTLRVLCACGRSVWQAPNSRLTVTAPVTGWYWRDRIELSSCSGPHAIENPVSFEIRSGEVARWQDGDCENGCGHTRVAALGGGRVGHMGVGDASCGGWAAEGVPMLCCWELGRVWGGLVGRRDRPLHMLCVLS